MSFETKKIINNFLHELGERKKRTARTVQHYDLYLQRFATWLEKNKVTKLENVKVEDL
jgi:site-specific recombinase XerD